MVPGSLLILSILGGDGEDGKKEDGEDEILASGGWGEGRLGTWPHPPLLSILLILFIRMTRMRGMERMPQG